MVVVRVVWRADGDQFVRCVIDMIMMILNVDHTLQQNKEMLYEHWSLFDFFATILHIGYWLEL